MAKYVWGDNETQFFFHLNPDLILNAIDHLGYKTTGRYLTLNSMENRVYEVEIDLPHEQIKSPSDTFIVTKFYRPGRWTKEQILEEHQFLLELQEQEIPVIAPIKLNGETLFKVADHDLWFTIFPKKGGRIPDEMNHQQFEIMGRLLARLHNVGASQKSKHRIEITPESFGRNNINYLIENNFIPPHYSNGISKVVEDLCQIMTPLFKGITTHRIHGDCHHGNIILREDHGPYFIDFDDMMVGPAIQDIWLVVPGTDNFAVNDRNILIESYESMRPFDYKSLKLIEPLRALRYIHFAAWMAKRWDDPAFKRAFPHFGSENYWETLRSDLNHQLDKITQQENQISYY